MGGVTNAFRKILGIGERAESCGMVLASKHFERVAQTVRRLETRAEARQAAGVARPVAAAAVAAPAAQAAQRPNLTEWDLPPGLASVVQAEASRGGGPARRMNQGPEARGSKSSPGVPRQGAAPLQSAEMEALLSRLAE